MAMIRVVQQKHGGKICNTLWCFCLKTSRFGRGGLSCSLKLTIKSVHHAKFLGAQVVINYSSQDKFLLIIVLRHVFNFISEILFIMYNNDVELRLPCQEGALGKDSQLSLVKIRNSMTKASKRIKRSFLKEEKVDRGKRRKVFRRGGHSFLLWISKKL